MVGTGQDLIDMGSGMVIKDIGMAGTGISDAAGSVGSGIGGQLLESQTLDRAIAPKYCPLNNILLRLATLEEFL